MTPDELLAHYDSGELWPRPPEGADVAAAYRDALAVRGKRAARGERPRGYKIGFTNRGIWPVYQVFAPIWGTMYDSTITFCEGQGSVSLERCCQPRLEPEAVFGMRTTPPADCTAQQLFDSIEWVAPGFEIVQSHLPDWKFRAADTVADGALHARLLVGRRVPVRDVASDAAAFDGQLANARVALRRGDTPVEQGRGANVLDGPLRALHYFLRELRACPGAPDLQPGDVITTGTWTNAWGVAPGQVWTGEFASPLSALEVRFT